MQKDFPKQFIKGKIAEIVFDQMFREDKKYTIIPFGYESIIPQLSQYMNNGEKGLLDNVRNAPDFALVRHDPEQVILVEVKYRTDLSVSEIKQTSKDICDKWKFAWIFVATPNGFYFDKCNDLAGDKMVINSLSSDWISLETQSKYLDLLKEFIK